MAYLQTMTKTHLTFYNNWNKIVGGIIHIRHMSKGTGTTKPRATESDLYYAPHSFTKGQVPKKFMLLNKR